MNKLYILYFLTEYNMTWTSYHRLSDIYGYMNYLAVTYPSLVSLINIGTSYEKRPLYVLRISNSSSPGEKPAIWIDAGRLLSHYRLQ